jgi:hypothetical protein
MRGSDWTPQLLENFVDQIAGLHDEGQLPFALHLPGGNEQQLIDIFKDIDQNDYVISTHRNCYHALLHGLPAEEVKSKIGSARSMFMFDRKRNFFVSAIIGGTPGIAAGIAWALKRKGSSQRVWCFVGDGIEDTGHFSEAVRYVDSFDLPCTFVIEDDGMAVEASKSVRWGTDRSPTWPQCVKRYEYKKTRPHIRTGRFADIEVMKSVKKSDLEYFPTRTPRQYLESPEQTKSSLTFKDAAIQAMTKLGEAGAIFIGYSIIPGDAMGHLINVDQKQKIETPVAENLMVSLAIGMSFEGFLPVVYFERHDFMLVAADAIGNHLDKINRISHGEFNPRVILKTVVDDGGLFYSGPTHSQNFTEVFRALVSFPILEPKTPTEYFDMYSFALESTDPVMIVERKSLLTS